MTSRSDACAAQLSVGFPGREKSKDDAVPIGPKVEGAGDELAALIHADRLRETHLRADPLKGGDHVLAPIAEPRADDRREP